MGVQGEGAEGGADCRRTEALLELRQRGRCFQPGWPTVWPRAAESAECAGEAVRAQAAED